MSHRGVEYVMQRLLTDWQLRDRFSREPFGVLAELGLTTNVELTVDEMRAFLRVDPEVWYPNAEVSGPVFH